MVTENYYNSRVIIKSENSGQLSFEKIDPLYSDENSLGFFNDMSALIDEAFLTDNVKVLREFFTALTYEEEVE